ncbi:hypothetical protein [Anoxybacteroides tepidamans]|uniref:hypothetical protein n=1 Tax=Anoxybacteroides tepidamans TaxID=265948 RepID=UPI000484BB12|nr:hypothetical protein [Anoxybacillus tepidamans]
MKKGIMLAFLTTLLAVSGCGKTNSSHEHQHMNHENMEQSTNHEGMHHETEGTKNVVTQIAWKFADTSLKSHEPTKLTIQVSDKGGKPIQNFEIQHEKLMHLIVVSEDLSYFEHLHPEYKGNGSFTTAITFPSGGKYKLYADYVPKGGSKVVKNYTVEVQGAKAKTVALKPDKNLTKVVAGKEITLSFDKLKAGREATLTFHFKDKKTGKSITNLQPYLGAVGHVVIIREHSYDYLHVHPMDEQAKGPDAVFMVQFPKNGIYQIWAQFQHEGNVITVPFTVKVS